MMRSLVTAAVLVLAGCNGPGGITILGGSKQATEDRNLTAPHVAGSAIEVTTPMGSVEVVADPALTEVAIAAKVTASGETDEEAKSRLADIRVDVSPRKDGVLVVTAKPKEPGLTLHGGCSFVVRVPDAAGAKAHTGNGSVTLTKISGPAEASTGMGSVTVTANKASVVAHTGNGGITVRDAAADVTADSGMGPVTVEAATGAVNAKSGNGMVSVTKAGGRVEAVSGMGWISVRDAGGDVTARTGNGSVTVAGAKAAVTAHSGMGSVTLDGVAGKADADTGSGSVNYTGTGPFQLKSGMGSIAVTLPAGAKGTVKAHSNLGSVSVNGKPKAVTGDRGSKTVVLTDDGPTSTARTGNGNVTITVE
jgi:hypothetical protein